MRKCSLYYIQVGCNLMPKVVECVLSEPLEPHKFCKVVWNHSSVRWSILGFEFVLCPLPHGLYVVGVNPYNRVHKKGNDLPFHAHYQGHPIDYTLATCLSV